MRGALLVLLAIWLAIKLTFALHVVPERAHERQPQAIGEQLAALVPPDQTLYLFRLKDAGILFYFGRPTQRLAGPEALPVRPLYCLLVKAEWDDWPRGRRAEVVAHLFDEQKAPLVLVKAAERRESSP